MSDDITYNNEQEALLDLCLRNATRYATGEIQYTMHLHAQLEYAYEHCSENVRQVLKTVFDVLENDEL